jgi:hypothetical protein
MKVQIPVARIYQYKLNFYNVIDKMTKEVRAFLENFISFYIGSAVIKETETL